MILRKAFVQTSLYKVLPDLHHPNLSRCIVMRDQGELEASVAQQASGILFVLRKVGDVLT